MKWSVIAESLRNTGVDMCVIVEVDSDICLEGLRKAISNLSQDS
jgi:hypothetical protein